MTISFSLSDSRDRARSVAATVAIHLALGAALLTGLALNVDRKADEALKSFNVAPPLPPPPVVPEQTSASASEQPAPAGKKADPSPVVAPPTRLPAPQPLPAAPAAGTGSSPTAGAAASGTGTGADGAGKGRGGGGGEGAGRVGARLVSGALGRRDYRQIDAMGSSRGSAELLLLINPVGRVERCRALRSSGNAAIDDMLCRKMIDNARFQPAREADGTPLYQDIRYFPRWDR